MKADRKRNILSFCFPKKCNKGNEFLEIEVFRLSTLSYPKKFYFFYSFQFSLNSLRLKVCILFATSFGIQEVNWNYQFSSEWSTTLLWLCNILPAMSTFKPELNKQPRFILCLIRVQIWLGSSLMKWNWGCFCCIWQQWWVFKREPFGITSRHYSLFFKPCRM